MYLRYYYQKARIALAEVSHSFARSSWLVADDSQGGIANVYTPSNEEVEKARLRNERFRRESFNKKDASRERMVVEKAKEALPGKSPSREPIERA